MSSPDSQKLPIRVYALAGRAAYLGFLPGFRMMLRNTNRAYGLVVCEQRVLVVRNWLSRSDWRLPGGGVHKDELPAHAVTRELKEELGMKLKSSQLKSVAEGVWKSDSLGFSYEVYMIRLIKKPNLKLRWMEILDYAWLPPAALDSSNTVPEVLDALKSAGLKAR